MNDVSFNRDDRDDALAGRRDASHAHAEPAPGAVPVVTQYLRIAIRWKWLILSMVVATMLLALIFTLLATRQYTATARVEIARDSNRVVNVADVQPETSVIDAEFYQTQYGLLEAQSLAERVGRNLRLAEDPAFFRLFGENEIADMLASRSAASRSPAERDRRFKAATKILLDHLSISPIRLSRLVDIRWTSPDPALSTRVANAWAAGFIEGNLERRFEATSYARRFLEQRLEQLRGRLEESERQLVGYASRESIINIPVATNPGQSQERSITADSLAALNIALSQATADRVQAQSRVRSSRQGAVSEALTNPAIGAMRQRRAEAAAEYARLMTQFEPGYPPAQALASQVRTLDQSIAREEARVQSSLGETYNASVDRERMLNERVEGLKQSFLDQRRRSIQYNIFQRDVDTNRQLYDGLLQRYKEVGIAGGVGTNNISIVDPAQPPRRPSSPRPLINLLLAMLVGTGLGVGLALVREQMDETITDPSDLEKKIGLPLLGAIPKSEGSDTINEVRDPKSNVLEAYLSVQTSLAFSTDHGIPKTLTVTSTRPAEGKTTTAFAIAYMLARGGARTLLVDADMRSPSIHADLGLPNAVGLSNYLSGGDKIEDLIQKSDGNPFDIMTAGPQPPNAAELLRGQRLETLLAQLSANYDHVVIDSPPVMGLSDAPIIASHTDGTLFVVEARGVKARMAELAIGRLRQARAHLLGTVLTKFDSRRAHFGYGYDYGYGYGSSKSA
ncbi:MAG: polysaccharide biosynthesis transport protein [Sphingomonadales bacterium]|nr:polysaccharide biosynthesis transport protein [Sphingomonadales bacterium]